jgi:hypothetical protein
MASASGVSLQVVAESPFHAVSDSSLIQHSSPHGGHLEHKHEHHHVVSSEADLRHPHSSHEDVTASGTIHPAWKDVCDCVQTEVEIQHPHSHASAVQKWHSAERKVAKIGYVSCCLLIYSTSPSTSPFPCFFLFLLTFFAYCREVVIPNTIPCIFKHFIGSKRQIQNIEMGLISNPISLIGRNSNKLTLTTQTSSIGSISVRESRYPRGRLLTSPSSPSFTSNRRSIFQEC